MKMKCVVLFAGLMLPIIASACDKPAAPALPDPETSVTAQMVKARNDMNAWVEAVKSYLQCERNSRRHDDAVTELETHVEAFNQSIRAYKARMENA
jgi:hypothetical protein